MGPVEYERVGRLAQTGEPRDLEEATKACVEALNADVNDYLALYLLGYIFSRVDKHGLAYAVTRRAADLAPHEPAVWHNLGKHCYDALRYAEAEQHWRHAIKMNSNFVNSLDGLGLLNLNRGEHGLAIEYCNRALVLEPDKMDPMVNRGMAYLALKRWREGWDGYSRNLGLNKDRKERIYGDEKRWDGTKGKRIVCYGEQGIGDEISFASCLPDLARDSASLIIECDARLQGVFRRSFPEAEVHGSRYEDWTPPVKADYRVALGELPRFYRNRDEDFPGTPYLIASPEMRLQWRALLDSLGKKPKIGIAWSGGRPHSGRTRRSVTLDTLLPLLRAVDADWVSLQYTDPGAELEAFEETNGVKIHHWPWGVQSYDYDQTIALIAELDLVISVTTTAIHAAGALGKECWCLVPEKVMWRYLNAGSWFPWAKSVTLFRQKGREWPIHAIAGKLRDRFATLPQVGSFEAA